jgi:uncharacterized protein YjiS (DUF1127 family)
MSAQLGQAPRNPAAFCAAPRAARQDGWMGFLRRILRTVESRHDLVEMDARMLKDIGLTRSEAHREASRAPWDVTSPSRRG